MNLSNEVRSTLEALRGGIEYTNADGSGDVYLDNVRPSGMSVTTFRSHLSTLAKAGLYKVIDGFAWGRVKMEG